MKVSTTDLCDAHPAVQVCSPGLVSFGGHRAFHGRVATLKVFEDNAPVRTALQRRGDARILVVDGGGSVRCALVGGQLGKLAIDNGWAGLVVSGCVRDCEELAAQPIGVLALAAHPRKSEKGLHGGREGVAVSFLGVTFRPDAWLYADADGVVVSDEPIGGS